MSRNAGVPISRKISCKQASAFETTLSHSPPSVRMVAKSTASVPIFGPIGRSRFSAECAKLALDPPACPFRVIARAPIAKESQKDIFTKLRMSHHCHVVSCTSNLTDANSRGSLKSLDRHQSCAQNPQKEYSFCRHEISICVCGSGWFWLSAGRVLKPN